MDYLNGATDNEIAAIACLAAMIGSLGLMFLSGGYFGRSKNDGQRSRRPGRVSGQVSRPVRPRTSEQEVA